MRLASPAETRPRIPGPILDIAARMAGIAPDRLDPDATLARLGLDSLASVELVAALEDQLGRRIPESLSSAHTTLSDLAQALVARGGEDLGAEEVERALIESDSRLADALGVQAPPEARAPRVALLTGATGYLGPYLLEELLRAGVETVYCMVRTAGGDARARLERALVQCGMRSLAPSQRVRVVGGDITRPQFGLALPAWQRLAAEIDAVFHAAAEVNWVLPYASLREANVLGTLELLRLACESRPKTFHFVSSLSVCFAPPEHGDRSPVRESTDMAPRVGALPLGYARSKCVAETLVRSAASRGLPARIYRPGLIAGDSRSGRSNLSDIMAALIKGCIQTGAAPDLDWELDAPAVDDVARAIATLSCSRSTALETYHLTHARPRTWRECVLWMNLRGYSCPLLSYDEWRANVEQDTRAEGHALRPVRQFFLVRGPDGVSAAERFERHRRTAIDSRATVERASAAGLSSVPLDAALLGRYFDDYERRGFLPAPTNAPPARRQPRDSQAWWEEPRALEPLLRRALHDDSLRVAGVERVGSGSAHSIIGELTAWRSGTRAGLHRLRVALERRAGRESLDLVIKAKPRDEDAMDIAVALARTCDAELGRQVAAHRTRIGLAASHLREPAIYELDDSRLTRHMPRCYGTWRSDSSGGRGMVLESLDGLELMDSADDPRGWTRAHIQSVIAGLARIHAVFLGRVEQLRRESWIGHVATRESVSAMVPLWIALARHAAGRFFEWAGPALIERHCELAATAGAWWPGFSGTPPALIHHDFNLRNLGLRREGDAALRLCAYDWEMATIGAPQRDLVEFLSFVLEPDAEGRLVHGLIEDYRRLLAEASGTALDAGAWREGTRAALADLLISRLAFYAMIDRVRPQAFLPRVVRTWWRLDRLLGGRD